VAIQIIEGYLRVQLLDFTRLEARRSEGHLRRCQQNPNGECQPHSQATHSSRICIIFKTDRTGPILSRSITPVGSDVAQISNLQTVRHSRAIEFRRLAEWNFVIRKLEICATIPRSLPLKFQ